MLMIMEPQKQPAPTQPAPVMDIVPPPKSADEVKSAPAETPESEAASKNSKKDTKQAVPKVPKPPRQPRTGVGLAVFATVVIVLGLAALMVYAYLRTQGVSLL